MLYMTKDPQVLKVRQKLSAAISAIYKVQDSMATKTTAQVDKGVTEAIMLLVDARVILKEGKKGKAA